MANASKPIRLDWPGLRMTAVVVGRSVVKFLGRGPGDELLAGLEDGRICRVGPHSPALARMASIPRPIGTPSVPDRS